MKRETIQNLFMRVARDSGFRMPATQVARFTAKALSISPIAVWGAFADIDQMREVAAGNHPAVNT